jgi:uncharacterized protein (UPF0212 family)
MELETNLDKLVDASLENDKSNVAIKVSEFLSRLYRNKEDCIEDDCEEVVCPECKGMLETVFGSLPLQVKCKSCGSVYILREILSI